MTKKNPLVVLGLIALAVYLASEAGFVSLAMAGTGAGCAAAPTDAVKVSRDLSTWYQVPVATDVYGSVGMTQHPVGVTRGIALLNVVVSDDRSIDWDDQTVHAAMAAGAAFETVHFPFFTTVPAGHYYRFEPYTDFESRIWLWDVMERPWTPAC